MTTASNSASSSPQVPVLPMALTPAPVVLDGTDCANVDLLIAEMFGENAELNKKSQPSEKQQELAAIEQALSQGINSNDFSANMEYWQSLEDSLPKDSPLLKYVTAQVNLFKSNPTLEKLQAQYGTDLQALQEALAKLQSVQNADASVQSEISSLKSQIAAVTQDMANAPWYDKIKDEFELMGLTVAVAACYAASAVLEGAIEPLVKMIYGTDGLQNTVNADQAAIAAQKNNINAQSRAYGDQVGQGAAGILQDAAAANGRTQTQMEQMKGFSDLFTKAAQQSKA